MQSGCSSSGLRYKQKTLKSGFIIQVWYSMSIQLKTADWLNELVSYSAVLKTISARYLLNEHFEKGKSTCTDMKQIYCRFRWENVTRQRLFPVKTQPSFQKVVPEISSIWINAEHRSMTNILHMVIMYIIFSDDVFGRIRIKVQRKKLLYWTILWKVIECNFWIINTVLLTL